MAVKALGEAADGALIFVNLVDFDTDFGHRRDVPGYAACLEAFDARLPEIAAAMRGDDFCVITADHGNDPTWRGFDHTREHVPILAFGGNVAPGPIGRRETLADIAQTVAHWLGLAARRSGPELDVMSFMLDRAYRGGNDCHRRPPAVAPAVDE